MNYLYNVNLFLEKAVLFGEKSGTLSIEKRYFSPRKVPLFCIVFVNLLIHSQLHRQIKKCEFFLQFIGFFNASLLGGY